MSLKTRLLRLLGRSKSEGNRKNLVHPLWHRGVWCPIVGGLANQLICYRVGRMLADIHGVPLFADLSHFQHPGTRPLLLWNFSPVLDVVFNDQLPASEWGAQANDLLTSVTRRDTPHFWEALTQSRLRELYLQPPRQPVLADLWVGLTFQIQAREYYRRPENQSKFQFNQNCLSSSERAILDAIKSSTNSLSVHVRRTDFATHDGGLLASAAQYNQAISQIETQEGPCDLFIFSDDQEWCAKNLRAKGTIRYSPVRGQENGHKDLYLASQCRHKVLTSESTFSQLIDATSPYEEPHRLIVRCSARTVEPIFSEYLHA